MGYRYSCHGIGNAWGLRLIMLLLLLLAPLATHAMVPTLGLTPEAGTYPLALHVESVEDPDRVVTLADVLTPHWSEKFQLNRDEHIDHGMSHSAWWFRMRLHNMSDVPTRWIYLLDDALLHHVDVHIVRDTGAVTTMQGGGLMPFSQRPLYARTQAFPVDFTPGETLTLYVYVWSDYPVLLPMTLDTPDYWMNRVVWQNSVFMLLFGIMGALMVYNGFLAMSVRDSTYAIYTAFMACAIAICLTINGFWGQYLSPDHPEFAISIQPFFLAGLMGFGARFGKMFLGDGLHSRLRMIYSGIEIASLALALLAFPLGYRMATFFMIPVLVVACGFAFVAGVIEFRRGNVHARYYMLAWSVPLVGGVITLLGMLGVVESSSMIMVLPMTGFAMEGMLLSFGLAHRIKILRTEKDKAQQQLLANMQHLIQQEKMAALGLLSAGVAHDINNPNHFMRIGAQTLAQQIHDFRATLNQLMDDENAELGKEFNDRFDRMQQQVDLVEEGTHRIADIVASMRATSRSDSGTVQCFDPAESLERTLTLVMANYKQTVRAHAQLRARHKVFGHPSRLNQVFMNLLINACHAIEEKRASTGSREPGNLMLTSQVDDSNVWLSIQDDGCGMSEETIAKLFTPFFTTKGSDKGTGLGMSICQGIIEEMGGAIEVQSKPGEGTLMRIRLPRAADAG